MIGPDNGNAGRKAVATDGRRHRYAGEPRGARPAIRRRRTGRMRRSLRKPDWIRVKAPGSPVYPRDDGHRPRARPRHRLRGGRLPEYRRVLVEEARHLHDHGRHLHARLRLLQRAHRPARRRSTRPSRRRSADATAKLGLDACRRHLGRPRRPRRRRRRRISPRPSPPSGGASPATIEVLTPDFLRKDGAVETVVAAKPDVFNHNLETVPSKYLTVRPGRALLRLAPPAAAGEGTRPGDVHQVGHHGRPRRGAERGAPAHGRPPRRRTSISSPSASTSSRPASTIRSSASCTPEEFKAYETIAYAKGFLMVSASPLTRSSHHAGEDFARLRAARAARQGS